MSLKRRLAIGATAGALSIATAVVSYYEGYQPTAYRDPVGVATICYGHTATARMGQTLSQERCTQLLQADLGHAFAAVDRRAQVDLPPPTRAALASFVYNVGEGAFARSTLLRKLNAGDLSGACQELSRWVYAGGRKLNGLVKRRATERELCLKGIQEEATP
ncbi:MULTISPECIES: lysozyme [Halomonadaceae]|uniref:lysozyme n=1 Tax=Halomonadaceae TaxID=28256 RepID=UPI0012F15369|nr:MULTISPECIES: lysozyme [Halomonas]CAD5269941.1 Lysozyme RrrD [Halomonas sp. 156]CAD5280758.1 Lysozyme RrrD [Halomonas sp. 113]CAD5282245.1 Lysozyme RrrD [Halomonas sp. 59]CAD5288361.1 Lysozyme RrrD [Halomonas sp. I3]VXB13749.1 Lysozyme RrrD [Halomonas titanicae]